MCLWRIEVIKIEEIMSMLLSRNEPESASYEYNTALGVSWLTDTGTIVDLPYTVENIRSYLKAPMLYNKELRNLAWWAYHSNGSVTSAVDYMRTMHTLDGWIVCKTRRFDGKKPKNFSKNKEIMAKVLDTIHYKQVVRDGLLKNANDGIYFGYLETNQSATSGIPKYMTDAEVFNIVELNQTIPNVTVITLPVNYCKIIGRRNNSYVMAFNLAYFQQYGEPDLKRQLARFPKEIRDAWTEYSNQKKPIHGSWVRLDNRRTIITKIKSAVNEPWGVPIAISALDDIIYADYFTNTKRAVLDQINNTIVYETFPEGNVKGKCALTDKQQRGQHDTVKSALLNRTNRTGVTFFSLAAGTKLDKIDVDTTIFDEKNEAAIKDSVPSDLGIASSSLNGNTKGNYATATLNMELVAGNVYAWICDFMTELNKCINEVIIADPSCRVEFQVFPTTYVNRDKFFGYMKELYADCGGSLQALVAASGMDVDGYIAMMEYERENEYETRFPPHQSMYTQSVKNGRPSVESDNPSTVQNKSNDANSMPKPSMA